MNFTSYNYRDKCLQGYYDSSDISCRFLNPVRLYLFLPILQILSESNLNSHVNILSTIDRDTTCDCMTGLTIAFFVYPMLGDISVNGAAGQGSTGGASGGSIQLRTKKLFGNGLLQANGGAGIANTHALSSSF